MSSIRPVGASLLLLLVVLAFAIPSQAQNEAPLLNPVFQDQVVLQRDTPIQLWGQAPAGDTVQVMMANESVTAHADDDGAWSTELPSFQAGGPYRLIARTSSGRIQALEKVLVGDVFLCSGQSNMELPVHRTLNAPSEISGSANSRIRMLTIPHAHSATPQQTLPTPINWETASPETVSEWSAACYYFARDLQSHVDVPLGLLHSSWGGTSITAWMSAEALSGVGGYNESLSLLAQYGKNRGPAQQAFGRKWESWWRAQSSNGKSIAPWVPEAGRQWSTAPQGLGDWKEWGEPELSDFLGMLWHRTSVDLTAEQATQDAVLSLGAIDAVDQTWINGHIVGNTFGWGTSRTYSIPAEHLREGTNVIVVNVLNTWGQGGMLGSADSRVLRTGTGDRLPLTPWRYKKADPDLGTPPRAPWEPISGLSTLHNAMVAPLQNYSLRGVLWYQGESDTDKGLEYLDLLEGLKGQWRNQFGANLPVFVVQLANYGSPPTTPSASGWAEVREAQRRATQSDPHAGLAVTVDIGSRYDIHPANKQEVGHRLARSARHVVYDADVSPSGPLATSATRTDGSVVVDFEHVSDALVAYNHDDPIGFEVCDDSGTSCSYVDAEIQGNSVRLPIERDTQAAQIRYCWADSPVCTLYDQAGLPASPFQLEITKPESD